MDYETLYSAINLGVMPAWALLALAPRWSVTRGLVHSFLYPVIYGLIYLSFLVAAMFFVEGAEGAGMGSLEGVLALFSRPVGVLTGWTHYLVFDLFVGAWIGRDAIARRVPHLLVVPCLFFTLMFGPVGLLLYIGLRLALRRGGLTLNEEQREG